MKCQVVSKQKAVEVRPRRIGRILSFLAGKLANAGSGRAWADVSLVLTDDAGIARLNKAYFGDPGVTDVISFRYDPLPSDRGAFSGELFVNAERAAGPAQHPGFDVSRELSLYIAHGCNHLAGETDDTRKGYKRMRRRELRWLREAETMGLLARPLVKSRRTIPRNRQTAGRSRR